MRYFTELIIIVIEKFTGKAVKVLNDSLSNQSFCPSSIQYLDKGNF